MQNFLRIHRRAISNLLLVLWVLLLGLGTSCTSSTPADEVVAEYRSQSLTRGQLDSYLPAHLTPEDSIRVTTQYIQQWQNEQALAEAVEATMPDIEERIEWRLEDARRKILIDEMRSYLSKDENPDLISRAMIETYYKSHIEQFITNTYLFQFRYLSSRNGDLDLLKQRIVSDQAPDKKFLLQWAKQNGLEFQLDDKYASGSVLAALEGKTGADLSRLKPGDAPIYSTQSDSTGKVHHLFYMKDAIKKGDYIPIDLVADEIRHILVAKRQNSHINEYESRILDKARASGYFH